MTNYVLLLPPSEGKTIGGDSNLPYRLAKNSKKTNFFKVLENDRTEIYNALRTAMLTQETPQLEKLFELKEKNLKQILATMSDLNNEETCTVIKRYSGVMFTHLDYESLTDDMKSRFHQSTLFIDGLFGLLKPLDNIPYYKLKITAKIDSLNVTSYWKLQLSGLFDSLFKDKLVIDLLPQAHKKVVTFDRASQVLSIIFAKEKDDKLVNVGHDSKVLKGELIRYIVSKERISRLDLEAFSHSLGYSYSAEYSNEELIVYIKK